jgi:hypothetical protein
MFALSANETLSFWTSTKCLLVLLPELPALPIFAVGIYIMYRGVEIGHPVYSIIFFALIFASLATALILMTSPFVDIDDLKNVSSISNMIAMLFHHSSWAVISILR